MFVILNAFWAFMIKYLKIILTAFLLLQCCYAFELQSLKAELPPPIGTHRVMHANGRIAETGHYKNGLKHRIWQYYNANGVRVKREKWLDGTLIWQVFYNERGRTIRTIDKYGNVKEFSGCGC
jgi:hypothetical protein